jgi:hypothetical protein
LADAPFSGPRLAPDRLCRFNSDESGDPIFDFAPIARRDASAISITLITPVSDCAAAMFAAKLHLREEP